MKIISSQQYGEGQTTDFIQVLAVGKPTHMLQHRLQLRIHTDGYEQQAYATIDHWANGKWENVYRIHGPAMETDLNIGHSRAYRESHDRSKFYDADRSELLRVATAILGIEVGHD